MSIHTLTTLILTVEEREKLRDARAIIREIEKATSDFNHIGEITTEELVIARKVLDSFIGVDNEFDAY